MAGWDKPKIVVVCGPTATGKSSLALALAQRLDGEIISADSMQIYRGLVIGTAALSPTEAQGVPLHLSGFLPPEETFSVAAWLATARAAIADIVTRGRIPVICGGTGLYIDSLVNGIAFTEEKTDPALRQRLYDEWETKGPQAMLDDLVRLDPQAAAVLHPHDQKRILRALEQSLATGQTAQRRMAASRPAQRPYNTLQLGLRYADRAALYAAINRRVDAMMEQGLLGEARLVWQHRETYKTAVQAIGYKEFFPYFAGSAPLEDCVEKLKQATRNYAKRQGTWFRRNAQIHWLAVTDVDVQEQALALAENFLQG